MTERKTRCPDCPSRYANGGCGHCDEGQETVTERPYGEVLDEMDHAAKYQSATVDTRRAEQLRIQAVGAAISRRDWHAVERAYEAIRDEFDRRNTPPAMGSFEWYQGPGRRDVP
jgi:hypothetical protein